MPLTGPDRDHPHCEDGPLGTWRVIYWRNGLAADRSDATEAVLEVFVSGLGYSQLERYEWPKQQFAVESLIRAFGRIFEQGKRERSREINRLLGRTP